MMLLLMNNGWNNHAEQFLIEHAASFGFEQASVVKYYYAQRDPIDGIKLDHVTDCKHASHTLYVLNLSEKDAFVYRLKCNINMFQLSGMYERWNSVRIRQEKLKILSEGIDETI